jgi:hypothetical protein
MNAASASAVASREDSTVALAHRGLRVRRLRDRTRGMPAWNQQQVQRQAYAKMQSRVDPECLAPTDFVQQILGQRPEHRAGKATEQRERSHRAPVRGT